MYCNLIYDYSEENVKPFWPYYNITRPFSLVYYIVDGQASYKINGEEGEFLPNHLYIFPPNTPLSLINYPCKDVQLMFVHAILLSEQTELIKIDVSTDAFIKQNIDFLRSEICKRNTFNVRILTNLLATYIFKNYNFDNSLSRQIEDYIRKNYLDVYMNSDLSKFFCYSNSYIIKIFKERYGITPRRYALSFLLDEIVTRLNANEPIYKISDSLNFSSPENFSKFFKKHFGFPPSETVMHSLKIWKREEK